MSSTIINQQKKLLSKKIVGCVMSPAYNKFMQDGSGNFHDLRVTYINEVYNILSSFEEAIRLDKEEGNGVCK